MGQFGNLDNPTWCNPKFIEFPLSYFAKNVQSGFPQNLLPNPQLQRNEETDEQDI